MQLLILWEPPKKTRIRRKVEAHRRQQLGFISAFSLVSVDPRNNITKTIMSDLLFCVQQDSELKRKVQKHVA